MVEKSDVLIVGAGTAGTYMSWLLAKKGHSVIVLDKDARNEVGKRLDVIHFETDRFENSGIPMPKEGMPEYLGTFIRSTINSPDFKTRITVQAYQTIMRLSPFLQRMYELIEKDGVILKFSHSFKKLLFKDNKIVGCFAETGGKEVEFRFRTIIDASGTAAVVRTSLPEDYGVETFKLGPHDVMYVLLQYIKWKEPKKPHPSVENSYIYYQAWFGPSFTKDGAILGIGQGGSYENARKAREILLQKANFPPYEIIKKEQGITPYRRPPFSLVSDGFVCIGDAACITYPFTGHGVTATWNLCKIVAEVLDKALKQNGYISKDLLWDINVNYFRDQGAKFAGLLTQLSGILNMSEKEWNYLLEKEMIYKSGGDDEEELPEPNKEYEQEMSLGEMLNFSIKLVAGLLKRRLSYKHVKQLLHANFLAGKIKKYYEKYPETPTKFDEWVAGAQRLWKQKKVAVKEFPTFKVEYP